MNKNNEADIWVRMYLKKSRPPKKVSPLIFKTGDYVTISFLKHPFNYDQQYTSEVFKIRRRYRMQEIPMYNLYNLKDDEIKGSFNQAELQKVDKNEDSLWYIEKILRKRKRNGKMQYRIKWQDYDDKFNSWVDAKDIELKE